MASSLSDAIPSVLAVSGRDRPGIRRIRTRSVQSRENVNGISYAKWWRYLSAHPHGLPSRGFMTSMLVYDTMAVPGRSDVMVVSCRRYVIEINATKPL